MCSTYKTVKIEASIPSTGLPSCGYLAKWWTLDAGGNITGSINEVKSSSSLIYLHNIPTCFRVRVVVQACCGFDAGGNPRYSNPSNEIEIPITATYSASISQVSCTNGAGVYRISGTPNQTLQLSMKFGGGITYSGSTGSCAWLEGIVTAQGFSGGSTSSPGVTDTINPTSVMISDINFAVTIPPSGQVDINVSAIGHNVVSIAPSQATLEILSIDGTNVSIAPTSLCKGTASTIGCV